MRGATATTRPLTRFPRNRSLQWQDKKQVVVWPKNIAEGNLKFPAFVKLTQ